MRTIVNTMIVCLLICWFSSSSVAAQSADSTWTLEKCIQYALQKNISVRKSDLTNQINEVDINLAKQSRLPSLSASIGQNFAWSKTYNSQTATYGSMKNTSYTQYALSSSVTLFNGFQITNTIKQSELTYKAGKYDSETTKETISLSILSAYLQVIYAEEQVKSTSQQVESTKEQLKLAEERLALGSISKSDYLTVKSQLATEKQTLATNESTLAIDRVTLMQLLELPVSESFAISHPDFSDPLKLNKSLTADSVYTTALGIKPQIKSAQISKENAELSIQLARAGYVPTLTLSAGLSTVPYLNSGISYTYQAKNLITPTIGLTLSIPIYQNGTVSSKVSIAKINSSSADLDVLDVKNQLRKSIEQASVDVSSAEKEYEAGIEQYNAANESYQVALEKFNIGMINSSDFIIQKTSLNTAQSTLIQSKYNLIFSYKTLDFYSGIPLSL